MNRTKLTFSRNLNETAYSLPMNLNKDAVKPFDTEWAVSNRFIWPLRYGCVPFAPVAQRVRFIDYFIIT